MRRVLGTALVVTLSVLAGHGAASAADIRGSDGADRLRGTVLADTIRGRAGNDTLEGRAGADFLHGGAGRDLVLGHAGNERIAVHADGARDSVGCGNGRDLVNAELFDVVRDDCEVITRQLSRDRFEDALGQHETQVEPDSFAFGSTIVTVFQSGRLVDGGASGTGWATSTNAGRTWRAGFLPQVNERASDPVVAYDARHGFWLIATLGANEDSVSLLVSRSRDGLTWSRPQPAAADPAENYDKEWLACDNWPSSPYRGRCYLSYLDIVSKEIRTRRSTDGGLTWSAPVGLRAEASSLATPNGALPVPRPDGTLLIPFTVFGSFADATADYIAVARSTDGAQTFGAARRVSPLLEESLVIMRSPPFVSADVDAAGTVYLAWADCRFSSQCTSNGIVLATSRDGIGWTAPARVPIGDPDAPIDRFVPGLAVDPATSGRGARLAIASYSMTKLQGCFDCERVSAALVTSPDGGRTWRAPQRLTAEPMPLEWIADTGIGRMLGDYISTSFVAGRPVPVLAIAAEPELGEFRQAIFATTRAAR